MDDRQSKQQQNALHYLKVGFGPTKQRAASNQDCKDQNSYRRANDVWFALHPLSSRAIIRPPAKVAGIDAVPKIAAPV